MVVGTGEEETTRNRFLAHCLKLSKWRKLTKFKVFTKFSTQDFVGGQSALSIFANDRLACQQMKQKLTVEVTHLLKQNHSLQS